MRWIKKRPKGSKGSVSSSKSSHTSLITTKIQSFSVLLLPYLASIFTSIKFVTAQISKEHTTK